MLKNKLAFLLLIYLRELAKLQLAKIRPTVIGVTGSAGKTSLKNAIAAVLKDRRKVKVSYKANSESGIPLNILGLKPIDYSPLDWLRLSLLGPVKLITNWDGYEIYIAEMGIDSPHPPKNMEYLLTIVHPKVGVFLNVLPVHGEYFDQVVPKSLRDERQRREKVMDAIAAEKGKLIESLPKQGIAVLNNDDPRVRNFATKTKAKVLTFATKRAADLTAKVRGTSLKGFRMEVKEGKTIEKLQLSQLLDEHYAHTFLAAIAVGRSFNVSLSECIRGLKQHFKLPKGRMGVIPGIQGTIILDSSYNASRETMESALRTLSLVAPKRKVAILGDMRELGKIAKLEHEEVAAVSATTADLVITVGPKMRQWFVPRLLELGFPSRKLRSVLNPYAALSIARRLIRQEDTILIKGSQNTLFLEIVTEGLMQNPKDAEGLLCRRGAFWDKKREELKKAKD